MGFVIKKISSPHNSTIKKLKSKFEGVRKSVTSVTALILILLNLMYLKLFSRWAKFCKKHCYCFQHFWQPALLQWKTFPGWLIWQKTGKRKEKSHPPTSKVLDSLKKETANLIPSQQLWGNNETGIELLFYGYSVIGNVQNTLD